MKKTGAKKAATLPDSGVVRVELLKALRAAGADGIAAAKLRVGGASAVAKARLAVLQSLVKDGEAGALVATKLPRYFAAKFLPTTVTVAARLAGVAAAESRPGTPASLWKAAELKRKLPAHERALLDGALDHLHTHGQIIPLRHGRTAFVVFAEGLREWMGKTGQGNESVAEASEAPPPGAEVPDELLLVAYHRLVRESGGFPDVKIARLREVSGGGPLAERLLALWREGRVTFSRGDWSLADDAARVAAVELDGGKYLLVRFDD